MSAEETRGARGFFGRRKTKALSARKARLVEEALPRLRFRPDRLPDGEVHMEIGFGGGEHLARRAAAHPGITFIGVEPFLNGMAKMLGEVEDRGLGNVLLDDRDAGEVLDEIPTGRLSRIDLLYPDPWPKARHNKRRFVGPRNLRRIADALAPGGEFRFASDIADYVDWTLAHARREPRLEWSARAKADWQEPWSGWHRTRYEAKAVREGRVPAYLRFVRLEPSADT